MAEAVEGQLITLHETLGVPADRKISDEQLRDGMRHPDDSVRRMSNLAYRMRHPETVTAQAA